MQRRFISTVFLIILLNLLVKPLYLFGIDAQVQNVVGSEDYGLYFSLLNFSFLFNIVLDVGMTSYNTKNIAAHPGTVVRYLGTILGTKIVFGFFYAMITLGVALVLGYDLLQLKLLSILVVNQFLVSLILYLRSNFAGLHLFKVDAVLSVLDRLLLIIICALLLFGYFTEKAFQIEWFVYAQTASYGLTAIVALALTVVKIGKPRPKVKRLLTYAILRKSAPYALLILLMMLYSRVDAIMLERILDDGKEQAGIYAQGFRLLDAAAIFALLIAGVLLPMFSRMIKEREDIRPLLQTAGKLMLGVALLVGFSCSFFAADLMKLIYVDQHTSSPKAFAWIILCFIPMTSTYVFGTLLTAKGALKQLNIMAMTGFLLNILLNLLLIPQLQVEGAAITTFFTQIFTALWQMVLALKLFKLRIYSPAVIRLFFYSLFLVAIAFLLDGLKLNNLLLFVVMLAVGGVSLFLFKLIQMRNLTLLLKNRRE